MRTLPEAASLDHRRRQAKDLLAMLRASDASATLAEAQASVAREYGFEAWTQLKAAAEKQRAAAPEIAAAALVDELVGRYGLGEPRGEMRRIEHHWAGQVWELETGRVVFTELFDHVKPDDIEVEAGLVEHAIAAGIRAPAPIRTVSGDVIAALDGANWRAHEYVRLGPPPTKPPSPRTAAAVGRVLATLHGLALRPPRPVVRWLTSRRPEQAWHGLLERARRDGVDWADALESAIAGFVALDAMCDIDDPNPRAILSHAWAAPDAVRIAGPDDIVVVGWEHASAIPPDWELASALRAWSEGSEPELGAAASQSLLDAYRERTGGTQRVELAMFTASVTGALNWTATRIQIALTCEDEAQRDTAARNVPGLLKDPISPAQIERLAEMLT